MMRIENNRYFVEVKEEAAEITSFYDKELEIEYIWSGDATYWKGRNPILFPIIGSSYNKKYMFQGELYEMGNHGFARNSIFHFVEKTNDSIVLCLESNQETLAQYPFHFKLYVTYQLTENELSIGYRIENCGDKIMPFNFGLHPAFNCPLQKSEHFEDYWVEFSNEEILHGFGPHEDLAKTKHLPLSYEGFEKTPTWMYHNLKSPYVSYTNGEHGVRVSTVGFPVLAFWTPKAPFLCIEPWKGLGRKIEEELPFEERDAVLSLEPGKHYLTHYSISVF